MMLVELNCGAFANFGQAMDVIFLQHEGRREGRKRGRRRDREEGGRHGGKK